MDNLGLCVFYRLLSGRSVVKELVSDGSKTE